MPTSSRHGQTPTSASKSAESQKTVPSPVRSPVFEPLYNSDEDEETVILPSSAVERTEGAARQRRHSSLGSLDLKAKSSAPPPEMSGSAQGTALRSRGKTPHGSDVSDVASQPSHQPIRAQDQEHSKDSETRDSAVPFIQQPAFRLLVFSFTTAWVGAIFMYFVAFASHDLELSADEQHLLTANSLFASTIRLSPRKGNAGADEAADQFSINTFLFVMRIPRHAETRHVDFGQKDLTVPGHETKIWSLWLNRGSHVQVNFLTPESGLRFAIIKGSKDVQPWKRRPVGSLLRGKGGTSFVCQEEAVYNFAFYNPQATESRADISLAVSSSRFDTRNAAAECELSFEKGKVCAVILPFGVPVFLVVATSDRTKSEPANSARLAQVVRISYRPRTLSYLVLLAWPFGVSFLAFLLSIMHQGKQQHPGMFLAPNVILPTPQSHFHVEGLGEDTSPRSGHFKASMGTKQGQQTQTQLAEKTPLLSSSPHKLS